MGLTLITLTCYSSQDSVHIQKHYRQDLDRLFIYSLRQGLFYVIPSILKLTIQTRLSWDSQRFTYLSLAALGTFQIDPVKPMPRVREVWSIIFLVT